MENQRDALQVQVLRLEKDIQESKRRELKLQADSQQSSALKFERDELRVLYDRLFAETSTLKQDLTESRAELAIQRNRLWALPGHVHSPITDPSDFFVRQAVLEHAGTGNLGALEDRFGLAIDEQGQLRLLGWLGEHGSKFPFQPGPSPGWRFLTQNGHFGHADAALMFALLLEYTPSHLIELGSGFSSLLVMDVNDRFLHHKLELTFVDPHPEELLSLIAPLDAYRARVQAKRSQELPDKAFKQLQRGDILSLDTSHVAKTGSDVCDIIFRILPLLAPGVLVHVHDIFYPFEYPEAWVLQDNRSWTEAYILRAFLQFNNAFRLLFFNDLMMRKYPAQVRVAFPGLDDTNASSVWLEKIG